MKALQFSVSVPQYVALKALGRLNRRLYYRGPLSTVKLVDMPEPVLPNPQWVKIKTLMTGFCGSDMSLTFLNDSPSASPFTSFPCVLGHEVSGEIVETGSEVQNLSIGDRVTVSPALTCRARGIAPECPSCREGRLASCENFAEGDLPPGMFTGICSKIGGGFAPYFVAHQSQVYRLPSGVTPIEGAMIEPLGVALQAVLDNRPQTGEDVLVIGGGVIGNLIVQSIRALDIDCRITVSEPSPFHGQRVRDVGADTLVTDGDIMASAEQQAGARKYRPMLGMDILMGGYNRIYDAVGTSNTLNAALRCLAGGGVLSVVGIGHDVKLDLTPLWLKLQTIRGVFAHSINAHNGEHHHAFQTALDWVVAGKVSLSSMVTHTYALESYAEMIEANLAKNTHQVIKTMVSFM